MRYKNIKKIECKTHIYKLHVPALLGTIDVFLMF